MARGYVSANQAIRLPDWMTPNPGYVIETAGAGTEAVMCMATDEDMAGQLPASLSIPSFTPMQGVVGLKDVIKGYEGALGSKAFSQSILEWKVASRRPVHDASSKSP
jgi:hypothetical protein